MSFYNRIFPTAVQKFVDAFGNVEPLDVVSYGGLSVVNATIANGVNTAVLAAPPAGQAYSLRRFASVDIPAVGTTGTIALNAGATPTWLSVLNSFKGSEGLDGILVTTGVSVFNLLAAGTCRVSLLYDLVTLPIIL